MYQTLLSQPLYTMARFGQWDAILAEPQPAPTVRFHRGMSHWARGLAYVHTGRPGARGRELAELARIQEDPKTPEVLVGMTNATTLLTIAREVLAGELAARERPVRRGHRPSRPRGAPGGQPGLRGAARLVLPHAAQPRGRVARGRPRAEAEVVYWQDLRRYRDNAFSLYGLARSLAAQGRAEESAEAERRYREAWRDAPVALSSSRY